MNRISLSIAVTLIVVGAALSQVAFRGIQFDLAETNPLAIRQSGYGMLVARLSQDTVNRIWHMGVEDHDHHHGDHDHDHDHGHHGHDDHHGHDHHAHHDDHDHDDHHDHAHHNHGDEHDFVFHNHGHDDHAHHDHDHGDEHDHGHAHPLPGCQADCALCRAYAAKQDHDGHAHLGGFCLVDAIESTHTFLAGLNNAKNNRTNRYALTERHKKHTAREIEMTLSRSYRMDPTNYGVYNALYLFLTTHNLMGGSEKAKQKAELISRVTISEANGEKENPEVWLTAASAALNMFFADQGEKKLAETEFTEDELEHHKRTLGGCLNNFEVLKRQRQIAGPGR